MPHRLKRLGRKIFAPLPALNDVGQLAATAVAIVGAGTIFGFAVSLAWGAIMALLVSLSLALWAAWGLMVELDTTMQDRPMLRAGTPRTRIVGTSESGNWQCLMVLPVANRRAERAQVGKEAEHVHIRVRVHEHSEISRWMSTGWPTFNPETLAPDEWRDEITLMPNGREHDAALLTQPAGGGPCIIKAVGTHWEIGASSFLLEVRLEGSNVGPIDLVYRITPAPGDDDLVPTAETVESALGS